MIFWLILGAIFVGIVAFLLRYNLWRRCVGYENARVLMYHSISDHRGEKFDKWRVRPGDFERQIRWLKKRGFKSYFFNELVTLENLPKKAVAITFDDGFSDNLKACEILQKYGFKATIFLVAGAKKNEWESENTAFLSDLMSQGEIRSLAKTKMVEFGAHTLSHANLTKISEENLEREILGSKNAVESVTGEICESFAYPYGKFDENIKNVVKKARFRAAAIVKRGVYNENSDKFAIERIGILGTESFFDFYLKITRIRNKL